MNGFVNLLVGFHQNCDRDQCLALHQANACSLVKHHPEISLDVVTVSTSNANNAYLTYKASGLVAYVEYATVYKPSFVPNDPFYSTPTQTSNNGLQCQWGLRRTNPEDAWDIVRNRPVSQVIAILDTGIDPNHPDLASKIVSAINFTNNNPNDIFDAIGHGTHVAGIAAAVTNNALGIAGMSFNTANIMVVKVLNGAQGGTTDWIIEGIMFAVNNGAGVINMSLGSSEYSQALQNTIDFAWSRGVVIVAAAGNTGSDQVNYPAGNNHVLAVSATNQGNDKAAFSSWGVDVGVTAPGVAILSTTPTYPIQGILPNYDAFQGTSMASPFVAGLAVMLKAIYPQLSNMEIVQLIQRSARPIEATVKEWDAFFGYGLIDASNAADRRDGRGISRLDTINPNSPCIDNSSNTGNSSRKKSSGKRKSSDKRKSSGKQNKDKNGRLRTQFGSFYGQVVNQSGNPIGQLTITAVLGNLDVSQYTTKFNILIEGDGVASDGMFRLANLRPGTYDIYANFPQQQRSQIGTATIVPGADVYLRFVI